MQENVPVLELKNTEEKVYQSMWINFFLIYPLCQCALLHIANSFRICQVWGGLWRPPQEDVCLAEEHAGHLHHPVSHHGLVPHLHLQDDWTHHPWGWEKNWKRTQNGLLNVMYLDFTALLLSFRVDRSCCLPTNWHRSDIPLCRGETFDKFRPMTEVEDSAKFPDVKEDFEEERMDQAV